MPISPFFYLFEIYQNLDSSIRYLVLSSTDGTCGVGGYIEKLQKWTTIGPIVIFVPIVFWIRFVISQQGGLSFGYLISAVFIGVFLMVLIGRVIRNVLIIRIDYSKNYQASGKNFEEISQKKIPPDPTLVFISTEWWKLPTIIYPVITSIWFFVELSGIAPYLAKAVQ